MEEINCDGDGDGDGEFYLFGVEQMLCYYGEKRKSEGLVSGEREVEEVILVGDIKVIKKFGFDGGEQFFQFQMFLFSK